MVTSSPLKIILHLFYFIKFLPDLMGKFQIENSPTVMYNYNSWTVLLWFLL